VGLWLNGSRGRAGGLAFAGLGGRGFGLASLGGAGVCFFVFLFFCYFFWLGDESLLELFLTLALKELEIWRQKNKKF